jgi:hypothetical protein
MDGKAVFDYKVFLSPNGKECFRYKFAENPDELHKKAVTKKDFDFTQSLLDFLYLDISKHEDLFASVAADAKALLETQDEKYIPKIKKAMDKIAGLHIYFEWLRLDWYCRVDRLRTEKDLVKLFLYEELENIPVIWGERQKSVFALIENVLDFASPDKLVQEKMVEYYSRPFDVLLATPFIFMTQRTRFEMVDGATFVEVMNPWDTFDIPSYFLQQCVEREQIFKRCKSCGYYFALTGYITTEYCDREYRDTGKTCREIGANISYQRKMEEQPAIAAYNKAYKKRFARIRYKKLTKEEFDIWAKLARKYRDECLAGKLSLEDYLRWLGL